MMEKEKAKVYPFDNDNKKIFTKLKATIMNETKVRFCLIEKLHNIENNYRLMTGFKYKANCIIIAKTLLSIFLFNYIIIINSNQQQFIIKNQQKPITTNRYSNSFTLRSHQQQQPPTSLLYSSSTLNNHQNEQQLEARGPLSRTTSYLYSPSSSSSSSSSSLLRGARNASLSGTGSGASWHFPRISPEQAAEVLLTGAQVINRIAQADTQLNYCKTPDNQEGECSDIRKCIWLVLDKARLKQSVCLRNLIIPAVCCPISNANNTPIANMIQSTLEPVLFRPKAPKQKKQPTTSAQMIMRPFASIVNKTIVGSPPPSPASLIIRNPNLNNTNNQHQHQVVLNNNNNEHQPSYIINSETIQNPNKIILSSLPTTIQTTSSTTTTTTTLPTPTTTLAHGLIVEQQNFDYLNNQNNHNSINNQLPWNRTSSSVDGHKYPWSNETCGEGSRTRTGRIVGGSDSKLGQWPWMTAMYLNKRGSSGASFASSLQGGAGSGGEFWCGGALINRRFILTAAHCLSDQRGNRYRNDQVTIKLGGVDLVRHQAPLDILKNGELLESRSSNNNLLFQQPTTTQSRNSRQALNLWNNKTSGRDNNPDDEEEFSWTSFITKALGLSSSPSASFSSLFSSSSSENTNININNNNNNNNNNKNDGSTKSVDMNKKQQLAAHAKKTYFKEYRVASIKQHPKFQRHGFYNDIGLIELKSDVDYDDLISPICLPNENDLKRDLSGYMATVLGWGTLSYGGQGSKLLQQVSLPIWNNKDCDDRYLQHIGKTFVCAGFLTGGKDACQGDSGGPLMVSDKSGRWTLHGVVSFGKTCAQAGYPGVYTRVTEYLDWLKTEISGSTTTTTTDG